MRVEIEPGSGSETDRENGVWKLFQRSLAKMDTPSTTPEEVGGNRKEGFWLPLSPKRLSLCPLSPQGNHCGMGEGGWDSWPGEGRWYQCLACVFSICPFVASEVGGREGAELGGWCLKPGLAALAAAAVWGRGH